MILHGWMWKHGNGLLDGHGLSGVLLSLRGAAACLEFECPWQAWAPHLRKFRDLALAIRPDSRLHTVQPKKLVSRAFRTPFACLLPFPIAKLITPFLHATAPPLSSALSLSLSLSQGFIHQQPRDQIGTREEKRRFDIHRIQEFGSLLAPYDICSCADWRLIGVKSGWPV